jgi:hypothetical protein
VPLSCFRQVSLDLEVQINADIYKIQLNPIIWFRNREHPIFCNFGSDERMCSLSLISLFNSAFEGFALLCSGLCLATTCHFEIGGIFFKHFCWRNMGNCDCVDKFRKLFELSLLMTSIWQALDLGNMNQDATSIFDLTSLGAGHTASEWAVVWRSRTIISQVHEFDIPLLLSSQEYNWTWSY